MGVLKAKRTSGRPARKIVSCEQARGFTSTSSQLPYAFDYSSLRRLDPVPDRRTKRAPVLILCSRTSPSWLALHRAAKIDIDRAILLIMYSQL